MKFEISEREVCGGSFGGKIFVSIFTRKIVSIFATETSPHSSHRSSQEAKKKVTRAHSGGNFS